MATALQLDPPAATGSRLAAGGLGPGRPRPDPFDPRADTPPGSRITAESAQIAEEMLVTLVGDDSAAERYLASFHSVPPAHMALLAARGAKIVVCRDFSSVVVGEWANRRRRRPATSFEVVEAAANDRENVLAVFDPPLDAIVCPVAPLERPENKGLDREYVALHEIAHALTLRAAWAAAPTRRDLLDDLTPALSQHVARYEQGDSPQAIRERVCEALAEAYRLLMSGLDAQIPRPLLSALQGILDGDDLPARDYDS